MTGKIEKFRRKHFKLVTKLLGKRDKKCDFKENAQAWGEIYGGGCVLYIILHPNNRSLPRSGSLLY